jgi:hypothetical protein
MLLIAVVPLAFEYLLTAPPTVPLLLLELLLWSWFGFWLRYRVATLVARSPCWYEQGLVAFRTSLSIRCWLTTSHTSLQGDAELSLMRNGHRR